MAVFVRHILKYILLTLAVPVGFVALVLIGLVVTDVIAAAFLGVLAPWPRPIH